MSMDYIRRTYSVPAKRGARVRVDWYPPEPSRDGTVTGTKGALLRVRLDGEEFSRVAHPTWRVEYLSAQPGGAEPRGER